MEKSSRIAGFHKMNIEERIKIFAEFSNLDAEDTKLLGKSAVLGMETAQRMIENVVGTFELPFGLVPNMRVNNKELIIPLAVEESSVVAAMANAAKMARSGGGFFASVDDPLMIAQLQCVGITDPFDAKIKILERKEEIIQICNEQDPILVKIGGGCRDVQVRVLDTVKGTMVITHILVNVKDAMGANALNTMAEALAPSIEKWTGGKVLLRILTNLADNRIARARCVVKKDAIPPGPEVIDGILNAWAFANADPYRAATHNKGIMNGISALVIATGNDFRAVEAGAHAYAAQTGQYRPLTTWEKDSDENLAGTIELPLAMGLVGGATSVHPMAKLTIKALGVKTAMELAEITAAAGLCQNLAALRALSAEGVQRGHMNLHAKNLAIQIGAKGSEIDTVAAQLISGGKVRADIAEEILEKIRDAPK